jgi:hypothetical protein
MNRARDSHPSGRRRFRLRALAPKARPERGAPNVRSAILEIAGRRIRRLPPGAAGYFGAHLIPTRDLADKF